VSISSFSGFSSSESFKMAIEPGWSPVWSVRDRPVYV
jgi:hypothetical protein